MKRQGIHFFSKIALTLTMMLFFTTVGALDFVLPQANEIVGFGSLLAQLDTRRSAFGLVPRSSIELGMAQNEIRAPASGAVVYIQREVSQSRSIFSFPLGNTIVIEHPEQYLSVISGLDNSAPAVFETLSREAPGIGRVSAGETISKSAGSGVFPSGFLSVSLYDIHNALWINPIFLAPWLVDHSAPSIQSVTLTRIDMANSAVIDLVQPHGSKVNTVSCLQGNYSIAVDAYDSIASTTKVRSAPYRFSIMLDGKTVLDTSFLGAKRSENGLAFLDNQAPSMNALTSTGLFKIGNLLLPRGEHDLIVHVSDYSGNMSSVQSRLVVR